MKINWLNRNVAPLSPHLCLCLSEDEYKAMLKHVKVSTEHPWVNDGSYATMHTFMSDDGKSVTCAVCLSDYKARDPVEVAGILVHEAVHIWQRWCDHFGEDKPGYEQEAYAIQFLSGTLMGEFARRLKQGTI